MKLIRLIFCASILLVYVNCGDLFRNADCSAKVIYTVHNQSTSDLEILFQLDDLYLSNNDNTLSTIPDTGKFITLKTDSFYTDSFHFSQPDDPTMNDCQINYHLDNLVTMAIFKNGQELNTFEVRPNSELSKHHFDDADFIEGKLNIFIDTLSISDNNL